MNEPSKPIKQFYNRKTQLWHVYYPNPKEGKPAQVIKETRPEKLEGVPVIGQGKQAEKPDYNQLADSLYKQPQNEKESPKTVTEVEDQPIEEESEKEDDSTGFFNFL